MDIFILVVFIIFALLLVLFLPGDYRPRVSR